MSVRYAPGDTFALVRPGVVLVVDATVSAFTIATLWDALVGAEPGAPTATVLDVVTSVLDPTLRALPDFALVVHQAEVDAAGRSQDVVHIAARGQMVVTLRTSIGSREVAAPEMTTWADQRVFGVLEYEVGLLGESAVPAAPQVLTITEGVVKVSALLWQDQPIRPQSAAVAATAAVAREGVIDEAALKELVAGLESIPAGEPQQYTLTDSGAQSIVLSSGLTLAEEVESDFARTLGGIPDEWTRSSPEADGPEGVDAEDDGARRPVDGANHAEVDASPGLPPAEPVADHPAASRASTDHLEGGTTGDAVEAGLPEPAVGTTFAGVGPYTLPSDEVDDMTVFSLDMIRSLVTRNAAVPSEPSPAGDEDDDTGLARGEVERGSGPHLDRGAEPAQGGGRGREEPGVPNAPDGPVVHQISPWPMPRRQEPDSPLAPAAQVGADLDAPAMQRSWPQPAASTSQPGDRMGDYVRGYGQSVPGPQHALDSAGGVSVLADVDPFAAAQPRQPTTSPTRVISAPPAPTAAQQFAAYQNQQVERGEAEESLPTAESADAQEPAAPAPPVLPPVPLPDLETYEQSAPVDCTITYAQLAAFRHPGPAPQAPVSEHEVVYRAPVAVTSEPSPTEHVDLPGAEAVDAVCDETTKEPIPDPDPELDLIPQEHPTPHPRTSSAESVDVESPVPELPGPQVLGAEETRQPEAPQVLARRCFFGHVNPSARTTCKHCGGGLSPTVQLVDRPVLGRVRFSSGEVVDIDQPIVVGRFPQRLDGQHTAEEPVRLMSVFSPNQDISRSHLEVRLDGWNVVVVDLGTMNGSTLHRAGYPPYPLPPQSPTLVVDGDLVDMGDGVGLTFEGLG